MQLEPGDILLHLTQRASFDGSLSNALNHAVLYVNNNNIAHSTFNDHQRGVRLHHIEKYFNPSMIHYDRNEVIFVFRPSATMAESLVKLALKFAIDTPNARAYINHKLTSDAAYELNLRRHQNAFTENGIVDIRFQRHVGAPLPTTYGAPRRLDTQDSLYLAINYLRAMRTCERAKNPSDTWTDIETNENYSVFSLSHKKGMGCQDFVMYLIFATIYENDIDETFKQHLKPITDGIWALHQQGFKLKQQLKAEQYYKKTESSRLRYTRTPLVPKSDYIHRLQEKLLERQNTNPILKIFDHAWRGKTGMLVTEFFIPLSHFTDVHANPSLFHMFQLAWPTQRVVLVKQKQQLSTIATITTPSLSQRVFNYLIKAIQ